MNKLRKFKLKVTANEFVRSVVVLMSGSALSQIAVVLVTPFLTRLYGPEAFGVFSVYLSILYTIAIITSLHYETAIPLPEKEADAVNLIMLSLIALVCSVVIIAIIISFFQQPISELFKTPSLANYLWYLPFSVLGFGLFQVLQLWSLRHERYARIARGKVQMNIAQIGSQTGLGVVSNSSNSLIVGEVLGRIAGGVSMAIFSWKDIKPNLSQVSWLKIKLMANRYRRFPLVTSWSSVLSSLSQHLPTLFIASTFGVKVAGWYLIANRMLSLPDALIGYSVKQVYLAKSAKYLHSSYITFENLFWNTVKKLALIGVVIFMLIAVTAPFGFSIIFGEAWEQAGVFVQCMSILFFVQLIVGPISTNFYLLEVQHIEVFCQILRLLFLVIGMVFANLYFNESWQAILCLSIAGACGGVAIGICSWYAVRMQKIRRSNS